VTDGPSRGTVPAGPVPVSRAFEIAFAHEAAGRHQDARRIYESILASLPEHPGALLKLAQVALSDGSHDRARALLERALRSAVRQSMPTELIWWTLGRLHEARGRVDEARVAYEQCLAAAPGSPNAHLGLGAIALGAGDGVTAEAHYRAAIASEPARVDAWLGLALAQVATGRIGEAVEAARKGRALAPDEPEAFRVESEVLLASGDVGGAMAAARAGLASHPRHASLAQALGNALRAAGSVVEARRVLAEAAALAPGRGDILTSLAAACLDAGRPLEARESAERALAAGFDQAELRDNLGLAHQRLGDDVAAAKAFGEAVARKPDLTPALANLYLAQRGLADWEGASSTAHRLLAVLDAPSGDPRCPPSVALLTDASMSAQLRIARRWSARVLPAVMPRRPPRPRGARLRVGYLSADFHGHATAHLIAGLFEHHDRRRFETFGYSHGPDDGSSLRRRVAAAFDHWRDLASVGDAAAADAIEADALDILIDLKGHTLHSRLAILARRPAPLQLHYLGYPGTLGYAAIDGIVADHVVAPANEDAYFGERVLRLPRCYQVNDAARPLPPPASRQKLGLPDDAVVLASFNNPNKLSAEFFATWMAALSAAPSAVLWLYAPGDALRQHLRAAASGRGVDPGRLCFAPVVAQDEHIARLRCADLALDVLPYGSHTTGSDALWAGTPLLSCKGATFAGRVGASLLRDVGLPELAVESNAAYADTLAALVADRDRLHAYRAHLERHRRDLPLFDTAGFTRDFEALLERAYEEMAAHA
jgi:predicted O-linked N-acetylglucosamine transferase (SPINDLY family)